MESSFFKKKNVIHFKFKTIPNRNSCVHMLLKNYFLNSDTKIKLYVKKNPTTDWGHHGLPLCRNARRAPDVGDVSILLVKMSGWLQFRCKAVSVSTLMETLIDSSVSWTIFPGNSEEISIFLKITLHFLHIWHLKVRRLGSSFGYFFSWIKLKLISSGFVMNAVLVNINWL